MVSPTSPAIRDAQNTERALRLLAAQRRLYSDAKNIHNVRLGIIGGGALLSIGAAVSIPDARVLVGLLTAVGLLLVSVLGGSREKRRVREAASVQEEFDIHVFGLSWNEMLADRPSPTLIAEAAQRYSGQPLKDWYADTKSVIRPLDVLICQRSNVGWGASLHRLWAAVLSFVIVLTIPLILCLGWLLEMSPTETLAAIAAPAMAPIRELLEMVRSNLDAAQTKASLENKILTAWRRGIERRNKVTPQDCRLVQDRILTTRQTNAAVPDWLNKARHKTQESTMQLSARHMIEEARSAGAA